jgi:hypothetical protein
MKINTHPHAFFVIVLIIDKKLLYKIITSIVDIKMIHKSISDFFFSSFFSFILYNS